MASQPGPLLLRPLPMLLGPRSSTQMQVTPPPHTAAAAATSQTATTQLWQQSPILILRTHNRSVGFPPLLLSLSLSLSVQACSRRAASPHGSDAWRPARNAELNCKGSMFLESSARKAQLTPKAFLSSTGWWRGVQRPPFHLEHAYKNHWGKQNTSSIPAFCLPTLSDRQYPLCSLLLVSTWVLPRVFQREETSCSRAKSTLLMSISFDSCMAAINNSSLQGRKKCTDVADSQSRRRTGGSFSFPMLLWGILMYCFNNYLSTEP